MARRKQPFTLEEHLKLAATLERMQARLAQMADFLKRKARPSDVSRLKPITRSLAGIRRMLDGYVLVEHPEKDYLVSKPLYTQERQHVEPDFKDMLAVVIALEAMQATVSLVADQLGRPYPLRLCDKAIHLHNALRYLSICLQEKLRDDLARVHSPRPRGM
jgi:hypothetical protein